MTFPAFPLAVGFVNPALLGALGLFSVPIIIHLLSRRQFRRVPWAATLFLLQAEKETRRRVRFEQWLLLALRCLAMTLLALLFARPFVQPGLIAALLGERAAVQRIIVLDDSASLGYRVGADVEFRRLRDAAARLISWLHQESPDDRVSVFLTSAPQQPLVERAPLSATGADALRARLVALAPGSLRAAPRAVFEAVARPLAEVRTQTRADVYVFSDFQRSDWTTLESEAQSVFQPLRALENVDLRVALIASGVARRPNVAVSAVALERPQTIAGMPAVVLADVASYGDQPAEEPQIRVEVDGAPLPAVVARESADTDAPARPQGDGEQASSGVRRVAFEVTFPAAGDHVLRVGLGAPDSLAADDLREIVVPVADELNVLLVNGAPATDPLEDEVYLLRNALAPPGPLPSGLAVTVIDPDEIEATDFGLYDCVLLCNVAAPREAAAESLARFVRRGGGVGIFLGDRVGDPAEFNRSLYAEGSGILPLPVKSPVTPFGRPAGVGLTSAQPHPVTVMLSETGRVASEAVRFRGYFPTEEATTDEDTASQPPPGSPPPARVLARYADEAQTPAIIAREMGRGRVLLFTSTADLDWNDWARAIDGSYVVTMLEAVQYLARRAPGPAAFLAGERLQLPVWPERYSPEAVFRFVSGRDQDAAPAERVFDARVHESGDSPDDPVLLEGPLARHLGLWQVTLEQRGGGATRRPLCVNLDPGESDLTVATAMQLGGALRGIPYDFVGAADEFLQGGEQSRRELWPSLVLLLVATLIAEQGLARWFGSAHR